MAAPDDMPIDLDGSLAELDAHLKDAWRREERRARFASRRLLALAVAALVAAASVPLLLVVSHWASFAAFVAFVGCVQAGYRPAADRLGGLVRSHLGTFRDDRRR